MYNLKLLMADTTTKATIQAVRAPSVPSETTYHRSTLPATDTAAGFDRALGINESAHRRNSFAGPASGRQSSFASNMSDSHDVDNDDHPLNSTSGSDEFLLRQEERSDAAGHQSPAQFPVELDREPAAAFFGASAGAESGAVMVRHHGRWSGCGHVVDFLSRPTVFSGVQFAATIPATLEATLSPRYGLGMFAITDSGYTQRASTLFSHCLFFHQWLRGSASYHETVERRLYHLYSLVPLPLHCVITDQPGCWNSSGAGQVAAA